MQNSTDVKKLRRPTGTDELVITPTRISYQRDFIFKLFQLDADAQDVSVLSCREVDRLVRKAKQGDVKARNELITHNLLFIIKVVRTYNPVLWPDLVSEAVFGLAKAVEKFKPRRQKQFLIIAKRYIKNAIDAFIIKISQPVHIPMNITVGKRKVAKALNRLLASRKALTLEAVGQAAKMTAEHVKRYMGGDYETDFLSLCDSNSRDPSHCLIDTLADSGIKLPDESWDLHEDLLRVRSEIKKLLADLALVKCRQHWLAIFKLRYGLDGSMVKRNNKWAADEFGCTTENVRQVLIKVWGLLAQYGWNRKQGENLLDNGLYALRHAEELIGSQITL